MNFFKFFVHIGCLFCMSSYVCATPVSSQTAAQFYTLIDLDTIIKTQKIDPKKYENYAISKVDQELKNEVIADDIRQKMIKEVENIYKQFVESRLDQVQQETILKYKTAFESLQTEESVSQQLAFYQTAQGTALIQKLKTQQGRLQDLRNTMPMLLAEQKQLQNWFNSVLGEENK